MLTVEEVVGQGLDVGHEPFVFFSEPVSGRGHVVYRRHDGHYGLVNPQ